MDEQRHVALPKLYGAPAYARPPVVPANPVSRPIDPDDLPLVAEMTDEHPGAIEDVVSIVEPQDIADPAPAPVEPSDGPIVAAPAPGEIQPRPFSIRLLAERIRGSRP